MSGYEINIPRYAEAERCSQAPLKGCRWRSAVMIPCRPVEMERQMVSLQTAGTGDLSAGATEADLLVSEGNN